MLDRETRCLNSNLLFFIHYRLLWLFFLYYIMLFVFSLYIFVRIYLFFCDNIFLIHLLINYTYYQKIDHDTINSDQDFDLWLEFGFEFRLRQEFQDFPDSNFCQSQRLKGAIPTLSESKPTSTFYWERESS